MTLEEFIVVLQKLAERPGAAGVQVVIPDGQERGKVVYQAVLTKTPRA